MDVPYLFCNYPNRHRTSCSTRKLPDRDEVGLQLYSARTFHVTLFPRIYKGGQGPPRNTSTPKAIQTTTQDNPCSCQPFLSPRSDSIKFYPPAQECLLSKLLQWSRKRTEDIHYH